MQWSDLRAAHCSLKDYDIKDPTTPLPLVPCVINTVFRLPPGGVYFHVTVVGSEYSFNTIVRYSRVTYKSPSGGDMHAVE